MSADLLGGLGLLLAAPAICLLAVIVVLLFVASIRDLFSDRPRHW